jgi:hypothetical protein
MSVVDLNDIKEQIQTLFESANTTTGTTGVSTDLSASLSTRIQSILKINPDRLLVQAPLYPCVTAYIDDKTKNEDQITPTQTSMKRVSTVNVKVAGLVQNFVISDLDEDAADNECEILMGNVEAVLAEDATLGGSVVWQFPTEVIFHNETLDEGANIRVGVLNLECLVLH